MVLLLSADWLSSRSCPVAEVAHWLLCLWRLGAPTPSLQLVPLGPYNSQVRRNIKAHVSALEKRICQIPTAQMLVNCGWFVSKQRRAGEAASYC